jgi:hypothetical protein
MFAETGPVAGQALPEKFVVRYAATLSFAGLTVVPFDVVLAECRSQAIDAMIPPGASMLAWFLAPFYLDMRSINLNIQESDGRCNCWCDGVWKGIEIDPFGHVFVTQGFSFVDLGLFALGVDSFDWV